MNVISAMRADGLPTRVNSSVEIAIVILLTLLERTLIVLQCGKCFPLALIAADFEQLLSGSVFWRKAVLEVRLKSVWFGMRRLSRS